MLPDNNSFTSVPRPAGNTSTLDSALDAAFSNEGVTTNKAFSTEGVVANKAFSLEETKRNKELNLGMKTQDDHTQEDVSTYLDNIEQEINSIDPDYRSDPDSLMSDMDAKSGIGGAVNLLGKLAHGAGYVVEAVAAMPTELRKSYDAYRNLLGKALNEYVPGYTETSEAFSKTLIAEAVELTGRTTDQVTKDFDALGTFIEKQTGKLSNQATVNKLQADLGDAFDTAEGFTDGASKMLSAVTDNKQAAAEVAVESIPQMIALAKKGVVGATNFMALTQQNYNESHQIFLDTHEGREPGIQESLIMLGSAMGAIAIDKVQAGFVLEPINKLVPDFIPEGVFTGAIDKLAKSSAGKAVGKVPFGKTAAKATAAGITEPLQEATQTAAVELGGRQDLDALADPELQKKLYVAAGMGLGAGATTGGVVQGVSDVAEATDAGKKLAGKAGEKVAKAVVTKTGKTADSVIKSHTDNDRPLKAMDVIAGLDMKDADNKTRKKYLTEYSEALDAYEGVIGGMEKGDTRDKALDELAARESQMLQMIERMNKQEDTDAGVTPRQDLADIAGETKVEKVDVAEGFERVLGSKQVDDILNEEMISTLMDDKIFMSEITSTQTEDLKARALTHKTMADVSSDIKSGADGFKGLTAYIEEARAAIDLGSETRATKTLTAVTKLKTHLEEKRQFILSKMTEMKVDGKVVGKKTFEEYGGIEISGASIGIVKAIDKDVNAVAAVINEIATSTTVEFGEGVVKVADEASAEVVATETSPEPVDPGTKKVTPKKPVVAAYKKEAPAGKKPEAKKPSAKDATTKRIQGNVDKLKGLDESYLSDNDKKLRNRLIDSLEIAVRTGKMHKSTQTNVKARYNTLIKEYNAAVKAGKSQTYYDKQAAGKDTQSRSLGDLVSNILHSGLRAAQSKIDLSSFLVKGKNNNTGMLDKVHNMFSRLRAKDKVVIDRLPEMNQAELQALQHVAKFILNSREVIMGTESVDSLLEYLTKNKIWAGENGDLVQDPLGYLIQVDNQGNRYLNENLTSTVSMISAEWLGGEARDTVYNDDATINGMLGHGKEDSVHEEASDIFRTVGNSRNSVADTLGARIYSNLGLKAKPDINGNFESRLKTSLGQLAIATMVRQGYLIENEVDQHTFMSLTGEEDFQAIDMEASAKFVRVATQLGDIENDSTREVPANFIEEFKDSFDDGRDLFDKIIGASEITYGTHYSPLASAPEFQKNSLTKVPDETRGTVQTMQQTTYGAKGKMFAIVDFLGETNNLKLQPDYTADIEGTKHVTEYDSTRGKNRQIERELKRMYEYQAENVDNLERDLFFEYEVTKNTRIREKSNTISMQNSKIHRHMFGAKNWVTTVNTAELRHQFKSAVVLAFGHGIDTMTDEEISIEFDKIHDSQQVKYAVVAIAALQSDEEFSPAVIKDMQKAIMEGTSIDGKKHGMYALDALVAMNEYHPSEEFTTNLAVETDGKTSGVIIGLVQSMTEPRAYEMIAAGGVFTDGTHNYSDWVNQTDKDGNKNADNYKQLAKVWADIIASIAPNKQSDAITNLLGDMLKDGVVTSAARNLTKSPLMITNYGAAVSKVVTDFAEDALKEFYKQIVAAKDDKAELKRLSNIMSDIIGPVNIGSGDQALQFKLEGQNRKNFINAVRNNQGASLEAALTQHFEKFNKFRNVVNEVSKTVFMAFEVKYNRALKKLLDEKGEPLTDQEKEDAAMTLTEFMPIFRGPLSQGVADGIMTMKQKKVRNYDSESKVQQFYNSPLVEGGHKSAANHISKREYVDGGVSAMILMIHAIDSAVIQKVLQEQMALNMFDAQYNSIENISEGTELYNKAWFDINKDFSVLDSVQQTLTDVENDMKDDLDAWEQSLTDERAAFEMKKGKEFPETDEQKDGAPHPLLRGVSKRLIEMQLKVTKARDELFAEGKITNINHGVHNNADYNPAQEKAIEGIGELVADVIAEFGSKADGINFKDFETLSEQPVNADNTLEIFDDLGFAETVPITKEHDSHLRTLLSNTINAALRPLNDLVLKMRFAGDETLGAIKGQTIALNIGNGAKAGKMNITAKEIFAHELIHSVTRAALDTNTALREKIRDVFNDTRRGLRKKYGKDNEWKVFLTPGSTSATEIALAKERFEYVFLNRDTTVSVSLEMATGHKTKQTRNNYLHEFVAFGQTNETFRTNVADIYVNEYKKVDGTILEKLQALAMNILEYVGELVSSFNTRAKGGKSYSLKGESSVDALDNLVADLTTVHEQHRSVVGKVLERVRNIDSDAIKALNLVVFKPAAKFRKYFFNDPQTLPTKALNGIIGGLEYAQHDEMHKVVKKVSRNIGLTEKKMLTQLVREGIGQTAKNMAWHTMLRYSKHYVDQARRRESDEITHYIKKSFVSDVKRTDFEAMNRVYNKGDMEVLFPYYNIEEIVSMLRNPDLLAKAIKAQEKVLEQYQEDGTFYVNQARGLGMMMMTGETSADGQGRNAHVIAGKYLVDGETLPEDHAARTGQVDHMASLFALQYAHLDDKAAVANVIKAEYSFSTIEDGKSVSPKHNGIEAIINLSRQYKKDSLKALFNDNPMLMVKGYTQEIYNPSTAVQASTEANADELIAAGYIRGDKVTKDRKDPSFRKGDDVYLYYNKHDTTMTFQKMAASLTDISAQGTSLAAAYRNTGDENASVNAAADTAVVRAEEQAALQRQFKHSEVTKKADGVKLVPVINDKGANAGYRYMMAEHNKVKLLDKDDRIEVVMGRMFGNVVDKKNSKQVNNQLIKLAWEDYDTGYDEDPAGFVEISASSNDKDYRDIYALMPDQAKKDIKAIWGKNKIFVRAEMVSLIFGQRKMSITDTWFGTMTESILRKVPGMTEAGVGRYKRWAHLSESYWQEGIGIAKDFIVVKSFEVLRENVISNTILLFVKGVSVANIIKYQTEGLKSLNAYMADVADRDELLRELKINKKLSARERAEMEAKAVRAEEAIALNPVTPLMNEGIFQTIQEDINMTEDIYGGKELLAKKFAPIVKRLQKTGTETVYKNLYFTHDSTPYKLLLKGTQYSDFIARFALYTDMMEKGKAKVSKGKDAGEIATLKRELKEIALAEIVETFVNYDLPTSKGMQYINDMGILMFTKFLFRIQKVIFKSLKKNPATNLALYSLQDAFGEWSDIPDSNLITSSIIGRLNNPMESVDSMSNVAGWNFLEWLGN